MANQEVIYEKKGRIAVVTINRPERMNAVALETNATMYDIFTDFLEDQDIWIGIITGYGGKAFCAGSDIKEMTERPAGERVSKAADSPHQEGGMAHREIWKPLIAAVDGYCLGGGLEIAMACDIIIASNRSSFGVPEIRNIGGFPGDGGIHRLPRHVPKKIAMQMLLTGQRISVEEAYRIGLINKIVEPDQVMDEAMAMANTINENSPIAARVSKEIATKTMDLPLEYHESEAKTAWELDRIVGAKLRNSEDSKSREGPRSFVEKRKPVWLGR
ncbi:MAG: enoyl-CoA hydratase-related protein [SAR202 cluster bacterium]|jgi:enoyl-CoA hydratase/carnithine racemase|nr:enoyl-CoA hydratase-related protein [SAR202 cluster bacterium]MDP6301127.1 enoyl-CoA hydratase-related protein [SAR202 cluster bacterium]MDP7103460.1 enoyl-CoA hydratase-related protein [SAR202 cluster bacterium]MDP7226367.1 enoyl-CoA hydratase-related protein [SAR202 cluster bacterium]MDP7415171.1 enoyl-CoA hydratase-related protein [SAR202 cluster bacterium]|tara:strand:+ start:11588 stop:12406 length:819 start_codon:yes stop_codon:yes gene_type:complete